MDRWDDRPQDLANLLNPAFDGLLLHQAMNGFAKEAGEGMPYELIFLVLPLVLHQPTRHRLPAKVTTHLPTWLQDQRDVVLGFGDRVEDLVPFTREAMLFLSSHGLIAIEDDGTCTVGDAKFKRGIGPYTKLSDEILDCYKKAESVGRWLALSGNSNTIFALMGIRP